jgi:sugar lactone lactonase YvrE
MPLVLALVALAIGASTANAGVGDLFVGDIRSDTIYKFTPDGTQSTFASVLSPIGLAFDSAGNLFVADSSVNRIYKFTPDGTQSTFAAVQASSALAFDTAGNLFEQDDSGTINKFTPAGTQSTFASAIAPSYGLAFDSAGNLFQADWSSGSINKFTPDGTQSTFASALSNPAGLAFDSAGNLFEADYDSSKINKFTLDGTRSTFALVTLPFALAFDSAGNLFVASGAGTIYKFTPDGTQSIFASGGLSTPGPIAFQPAPAINRAAQIQQPINADGTSIFNLRRGVIPVKFTLTQGGVATCDLPPATIVVTRTGGGTTGQIDESIYTGSADTGSNFRIDSCQYLYNLNSRSLGVGTYRVDIEINAQVVGSGMFQLK